MLTQEGEPVQRMPMSGWCTSSSVQAHLTEGVRGREGDIHGEEGVGGGCRHHKLQGSAAIGGVDQVNAPGEAVVACIVLVVPIHLGRVIQ